MKTSLTILVILLTLTLFSQSVFSQTDPLLDSYKSFLQSSKNLSPSQLMDMHPAGVFSPNIHSGISSVFYYDSVCQKLNLTDYEKSLLEKNGFMVTERLQAQTFLSGLAEVWQKDLPLFISSDAILHSIHKSYDAILKDCEEDILIPDLQKLLTDMHSQLALLDSKYSSDNRMKQMLKDVDVYITIPLQLLGENVNPYYPDNSQIISKLMGYISKESVEEDSIFSSTKRYIDYSQFTVRGHYTDKEHPMLAKYFKAMMWLGRIEIYLLAPRALEPAPEFKDIQRQTIDAVLISELIDLSNSLSTLNEMDGIIKTFVGESDNVTLDNLRTLLNSINVTTASQLLDNTKLTEFQDTLKTKSFAFQRILSQILMQSPTAVDSLVPASAFLLLGQRFIVDSYVTGSVVYDKIRWNGEVIKRMLPSTLDVLFALGNNAAAQLLKEELENYHYSPNLAALRYLVDGYSKDFWDVSLYNLWLNSIRTLNPPEDRSALPAFMQTAGWWQEKINTQLASWTELRHDNLLYAKQSYTGGVTCSYPYAYVEPIPEFFNAVHQYAVLANEKLINLPFKDDFTKQKVTKYFAALDSVSLILKTIAQKELNKTELSEDETKFIRSMFSYSYIGCGEYFFEGWYFRLFYANNLKDINYVVADIHTAPTDEGGSMVGWVKHVGTGPINLGVFLAETSDNKTIAYTGPVMSYYEHTTTNFKRLTDEEWLTMYNAAPSLRPSFVNLYLAGTDGKSKGEALSLVTGIIDNDKLKLPITHLMVQNYPNPFNPSTNIRFTIPSDLTNSKVKLVIYNLQGEMVSTLVDNTLPAGNYVTRWNGTDDHGNHASSGVYFYQLTAGQRRTSGKMMLLK